MKTPQSTTSSERVLLVGVTFKRAKRVPAHMIAEQGQDSLDELVELARSAGADVAGTVHQVRDAPDSATLVGRGKLDEIRAETSRQCSSATSKRSPNAA
jgi:50S ribosomal subunit-associated GTPase HflX